MKFAFLGVLTVAGYVLIWMSAYTSLGKDVTSLNHVDCVCMLWRYTYKCSMVYQNGEAFRLALEVREGIKIYYEKKV
jgi:hypothetical protein